MRRPLNFWLLLVVTVCVLSIWFGRSSPLLKQPEKVMVEKSVAAVDFSRQEAQPSIHLLILNGTGQKGLARDFSLMVGRIGCVAEGTGNAPSARWGQSMLINRRLPRERAARLAEKLGGIPVIREFDGRTTEDAVLILGADQAQLRQELHPRRVLGDAVP